MLRDRTQGGREKERRDCGACVRSLALSLSFLDRKSSKERGGRGPRTTRRRRRERATEVKQWYKHALNLERSESTCWNAPVGGLLLRHQRSVLTVSLEKCGAPGAHLRIPSHFVALHSRNPSSLGETGTLGNKRGGAESVEAERRRTLQREESARF